MAENETLNTSQIPSHNHPATSAGAGNHSHGMTFGTTGYTAAWGNGVENVSANAGSKNNGWIYPSTAAACDHSHTITISNTGGGSSHNNMQPFVSMNYIIKAV